MEGFALCFLDALAQRALIVVCLEEDGAEGRRECECVQGREADGDGHGDTKLAIERTAGAAQERNRDEYGHHHEGDGDDGSAEFAHRVERCFASGGISHV